MYRKGLAGTEGSGPSSYGGFMVISVLITDLDPSATKVLITDLDPSAIKVMVISVLITDLDPSATKESWSFIAY